MNNVTNTFAASYMNMQQILLSSADSLFSTIAAYLPKLVGAILILILGYIVAKALRETAKRVLNWTGFSRGVDTLELNKHFKKFGIQSTVSELLASFVYWIVFLTFLTATFETLGLSIVVETLNTLIAYLPNVVVAAITIVLTLIVGRFVRQLINGFLEQFDISFGNVAAVVAESFIILFGAVIAANQLGFDVTIITANVTLIIGAVLAILVLSLGLGARTVAANLLGGYYTKQMFKVGSTVTLAGHTGTVKVANNVAITLTTSQGEVIVPNEVVMKNGSLTKA